MTTRLVLASRNAHKLVELRRILEVENLDVEIVGVEAYPEVADVAETGQTFEENALLKARAVAAAVGDWVIADDSGLSVDALNGMPGVLSARWSGRHGDDRANLELVLGQLGDVPDERRGAAFVCVAVAIGPDGEQVVAHGTLTGTLARRPRGENGFGYDPIFVPLGYARTTAELSAREKDVISHRGLALRALAAQLSARLPVVGV